MLIFSTHRCPLLTSESASKREGDTVKSFPQKLSWSSFLVYFTTERFQSMPFWNPQLQNLAHVPIENMSSELSTITVGHTKSQSPHKY